MPAPSVEERLAALELQVAWNTANITPKPEGWKKGDPVPHAATKVVPPPA